MRLSTTAGQELTRARLRFQPENQSTFVPRETDHAAKVGTDHRIGSSGRGLRTAGGHRRAGHDVDQYHRHDNGTRHHPSHHLDQHSDDYYTPGASPRYDLD